jgi:Tfp pilus assembly protein PilF
MTRPNTLFLAVPILAAGLLSIGACSTAQKADTAGAIEDADQRARRALELAAQADKARLAGDTERAMTLYRESIEQSPEFADVWNNLGLLHLEANELDKALSAFSMAAELDPADPRPHTNIGITNLRAGWAEYALQDFHKALTISPSYLPALRGAVRAADLLGQAEFEDLDRVRRALLAERDEQWRAYLERQRYLIESRLRSPRTTPPAGASATP